MLKIERRGKKGIFQVIGKIRGRRVHQSTGTTSQSHAEAERVRIEHEILDEEIYGKRAVATFATAVNAYFDQGGSDQYVEPLLKHFGMWQLSAITQSELLKFAKQQYPEGSKATINRQVFTPMIAIWNAARDAKLCGPHEFRRPKRPERKPVEYARDDFLAKLLPECGERLCAAVLLISFTGARAGEACRLESRDVDWENRTALLQQTKSGNPRVVSLPDIVYKAMLRFKDTKGPLFGFGQRWTLNQALARACKRAGLPIMTSHKIGRHAFAARLLKQGHTLKEVQEAGGWSPESYAMLARTYGHLEKSAVEGIVRGADAELTQMIRKSVRKKMKVVADKGKSNA